MSRLPWFFAIILLGQLAVCSVLFAGQSQKGSWTTLAPALIADSETVRNASRVTQTLVADERATLKAEMDALKEQNQAAEAELNGLIRQFEALLQEEQKLEAALEEGRQDMETLSGVLRSTAKEADTLVAKNPVTGEIPNRRAPIALILDQKRFPGFNDIRNLTEIFFQEMNATEHVVVRKGEFIGLDGVMSSGEILRAGRFLTAYRQNGTIGFLRPNKAGDHLLVVAGEATDMAAKDISRWMDNATGGPLPLDPSGEAAFVRIARERNLADWLASGGLLVWPILAFGALALLLAAERAVFLARYKADSSAHMVQLHTLATQGDWKAGKEYCRKHKMYPGCLITGELLAYAGESQEVLESALEESIMREIPKLERFLPTLSVLAAASPLLGLLGTVTGMINTFQVITIFGTGDPRMMSGGISEALITTQLGLAVAIPIMLVHHLLGRRVERIITDMEESGAAFVLQLLRRKSVGGNLAGDDHA